MEVHAVHGVDITSSGRAIPSVALHRWGGGGALMVIKGTGQQMGVMELVARHTSLC